MQNLWLPSRDYHEDLSLPRLIKFGNLLRGVWRRVSELHEPSEGDGMWSLSCRAFQRCGHQLELKQQEWPWLSIMEAKKMQWVVTIGMIPVRFYHGDSLEMPSRYSSPPEAEKVLRQAILNLDDRIQAGVLLRFVTQTDTAGVPLTVKLVQYDEELDEVINTFVIPEAAEGTSVVDFPTSQPKPGVPQRKPSVRPLTGRVKDQIDDDADPSR